MIPERQYYANPEYIFREIAGERILIPTGSKASTFNGLASLNDTGWFLWQLLSQPRTPSELASALAREYELTEDQSECDVRDFLELAVSRELVLVSEDQMPNSVKK